LPAFAKFRVVKYRIQIAQLALIAMDHDPIAKFQGITFLGGSRWFMVRFFPFPCAQPPSPLTNRS
jgi:hypothetical protein